MDKRYQVFLSSTYTDLVEERQQVLQTLLQMDCIPTGMEFFPAADEEQLKFIRRVIDDCDYYILILGGRYGSITADGLSFTEMEFDYAVEKNIHVIALVHGNPDVIPVGKSELDPTAREKLESFRSKVCKDRMVKKWNTASELPGLVALSMVNAIKSYPAIGWVRADAVSNIELLEQINNLRQRNDQLANELSQRPHIATMERNALAKGDEKIAVKGYYKISYDGIKRPWNSSVSWDNIISFLGPHLLMHCHEDGANSKLSASILKKDGNAVDSWYETKMDEEILQTIKVQLMALGWIDVMALQTVSKNMALFWIITDIGKRQMLQVRSVKTSVA